MALLTSQSTSFTLDNMGRYLCNTSQEARASAAQPTAGRKRDFDVIVIGGGSFGSAIAARLFTLDRTHSRRILVLEQGPFVLPEHVQNLPFMGGDPSARTPWVSNTVFGFAGLIYAIGGRSMTWGGWSPEPLHDLHNDEMRQWPPTVITDLQARYFAQAGDQLGVTSTNDFIYGELHTALRRRLYDGLIAASKPGKPLENKVILNELPNHPAVRKFEREHGALPADTTLRDLLNLLPTDLTPQAELLTLLKLEAPLAVQASTEPGLFPFNKFSAIPLLTQASRIAANEADGVDVGPDSRKRLMVVPNCHVLELITETQSDSWVRVTGVRFIDETGATQEIFLAPPRLDGTQSVVVIALGTIESTRLALTTFQASLAGGAAQQMGTNLMAHLRSNLTIRLPKGAIDNTLPNALQTSALFVKGKATVPAAQGTDRYFHLQITASGLSNLGTDSEAELFKKVPDLDNLNRMLQATDESVVVTLRGIGEMVSGNPDSRVELAKTASDTEYGRPKAWVTIGNAQQPQGQSAETQNDAALWAAMDAFTDHVALMFANGQPFEILTNNGTRAIQVPAGATASDLAQIHPHAARHDLLGSTHHEAGTLRMSLDATGGVTNEFGRIHDTTNCYVVGPALLPTGGSPNPMLTGVAMARRTATLLTDNVLPRPEAWAPDVGNGYQALFDGTEASFKRWQRVSPAASNGFTLINGEIVTYGNRDFGLLYYADEPFADFTLKVQFRIFDTNNANSGIFVRVRNPALDLPQLLSSRMVQESASEKTMRPDLLSDIELLRGDRVVSRDPNRAWNAVYSGFEIQIDDSAKGDPRKDFYGRAEDQFDNTGGLRKNRTGAIYKIPAGDPIPHLGGNDAIWQQYQEPAKLVPLVWYEYTIDVRGDDYTVDLTNLDSGVTTRTTTFRNTDGLRGIAVENGKPIGFVGLQSYANAPIAFRRIQLKP